MPVSFNDIREEHIVSDGSEDEPGTHTETHFEDSHLRELPGPEGKLKLGKCMGDGAYGKVYVAHLTRTQLAVALKVVPLDGTDQDEIEVGQEVAVLEKYSRHVNIARFYGAYRKRRADDGAMLQDELWLAMELCAYGSAAGLILTHRTKPDAWLPEITIAYTLHGLLAGLEYLHQFKVLHRDIKGQNVLYSRDGVVKLCDFGVSATVKNMKGKRATVIGTPYWMAPEVIACDYGPSDYDVRCDIWSFGIVGIELAEGVPPLVQTPPMRALLKIVQSPAPTMAGSSPTGPWSDGLKALVDSSLEKDHTKRPTATQLLATPYLVQLDLAAAQQALLDQCNKTFPDISKEKMNDWKSSVHVNANFQKRSKIPTHVLKTGSRNIPATKEAAYGFETKGTDNLAAVPELTEDTILVALKARLQNNVIFTSIGDILITCNPYKDTGVFTDRFQEQFLPKSPTISLPHIYATAQRALAAMQTLSRNQVCVISGESGAGKTETAKQFVRQILDMAHGDASSIVTGTTSKMERAILAMNPVLEALGNAKSVMNSNSSRFGKYLELKFDQNIHIKGTKVTHYLLEKSRLTQQAGGERNFHVFYYLKAARENRELVPVQIADCSYLGGVPKPDPDSSAYERYKLELLELEQTSPQMRKPAKNTASGRGSTRGRMAVSKRFDSREAYPEDMDPTIAAREYHAFVDGLTAIGFTAEQVSATRRLLAGILYIGNVDFAEMRDGQLKLTSYSSLYRACELLGLPAVPLGTALCTYTTVTRGETIARELTKEQARDVRDATAKALYNRYFNWVIKRINSQGADKKRSVTEIGVLDLFGFENFRTNCFEQLCINIANEQLQRYFNVHIFEAEMKELKEEGIKTAGVDLGNDNGPLLDMFIRKKMGFFSILDEECFFPNSSPLSLAGKLHKQFAKVDTYTAPKSGSAEFTITHFAEDVSYSLLLFIEKNRDSLSHTVANLFDKSENMMIAAMFSGQDDEPLEESKMSTKGRPRRSKRHNHTHRRAHTVAAAFKTSLANMVNKLNSCQPHFVRCIKPNGLQMADTYDDDLVRRQLRCCGVLATVKQRRDGYPVRLLFLEFVKRYQGIALQFSDPAKSSGSAESCVKILTAIGINKDPADATVTSTQAWGIGKTKVFLKYYVVQQLNTRLQAFHFKATTIQRSYRSWHARKKLAALQLAAAKKKAEFEAAQAAAAAEAATKAVAAANAAAAEVARKAQQELEAEQAAAQAAAAKKAKEEMLAAEAIAAMEAAAAAEAAANAAAEAAAAAAKADSDELGSDNDDNEDDGEEKRLSAIIPGSSIDQPEDGGDDEYGSGRHATMQRDDDVTLRRPTAERDDGLSDLAPQRPESTTLQRPPTLRPDSTLRPFQRHDTLLEPLGSQQGTTRRSVGPAAVDRLPARRRPSHIQAKREKKARNALRAKRRQEAEERKQARSQELLQAMEQKRDLFIQPIDLDVYDNLDQNLVGVDRIPEGCGPLNRYINILPNPRTRVRLKQIGSDERSRYINANFIQSYDAVPRRYIATQGPLPETVKTFWRQVWQTDSRAIVMVTGLIEKGTQKCARYWPKALYNPELGVGDVDFGDINVRIYAGFRRDGFVTTKFHVQKGGEKREIWHFWFDSWPDHGVPKRYEPVQSMLESCRKWSNKSEHPWIIHCSAGIGRTGTFIAIDHGIRQFQTSGVVDVIEIIKLLRKDRGGMVQHREQAEFVQQCLENYRQAHGASQDEDDEVLAISVEKAILGVPPRFEGHASQKDTEEGSESAVPSWRVEQIEDDRDRTREEIADLKLEHARKAGRMQAKEDAINKKKREAALLLAGMVSELDDDPNDYMSTMKKQRVGFQSRSHRRRSSTAMPYEFEEISSDSEVSEDSEPEAEEVDHMPVKPASRPGAGPTAAAKNKAQRTAGGTAGGNGESCLSDTNRMILAGVVGLAVLAVVIFGSIYGSPYVAVAFAVFFVLAIGFMVYQKFSGAAARISLSPADVEEGKYADPSDNPGGKRGLRRKVSFI